MAVIWTEPTEPIAPDDDRRTVLDGPVGLVLAAALGAAFFLFAPNAMDRELASDRARLREHQERLEREHPGALQRLTELAAEIRKLAQP